MERLLSGYHGCRVAKGLSRPLQEAFHHPPAAEQPPHYLPLPSPLSLILLIEDDGASKALAALQQPRRATSGLCISFPPFLPLPLFLPRSIFVNIPSLMPDSISWPPIHFSMPRTTRFRLVRQTMVLIFNFKVSSKTS